MEHEKCENCSCEEGGVENKECCGGGCDCCEDEKPKVCVCVGCEEGCDELCECMAEDDDEDHEEEKKEEV